MIDTTVLESAKLTTKRLEQIFTSKDDKSAVRVEKKLKFAKKGEDGMWIDDPTSAVNSYPENPSDFQIREFFEDRIQSRIDEGIERALEYARIPMAVDVAMDGPIVSKVQLPLQLLAQGYIDLDACASEIEDLSPELAAQLFVKNPAGQVIKANVPKLFEISHNLVHSLVTRRVASISTPIRQRHPMLKYEPRGASMVGQLKGDLVTQYAEVMVDNYGYRHAIEQTVRDVSCYTHQVEFITAPWDVQTAKLRVRKPQTGADQVGPEASNFEVKDVIVKEGVDFVAPHPSRVFWDTIRPLAKINSDTGPSYVGYWDLSRIGDLRTNMTLWNRESIENDGGIGNLINQNQNYFAFYYKEAIAVAKDRSNTVGLGNDRLANVTGMASAPDDTPVTLSYYFEKLNPKQWGIADYDHEVWIRFIVAGNRTVVWADVCPSTPAIYYGYNENDGRTQSPSFAAAVIPYQDQISNLLSQLLEIQHQGLLRLYSMNVDGMTKEQVQAVEDALHNKDYTQAKSIIIKYSAEAMRNMGIDPARQHSERLKAVENSTTEKTTEIFRSITSLLAIAERLLFFSPQELGQVAPREISATEANLVNNTTLGIRDFHAVGIEEGLDAKKRIIYESAVAFGTDTLELTALNSYSRTTVKAAGFTIVGNDAEGDYKVAKSGRFTIRGTIQDLVHNYVFTSRDGTERTPSQAEAQASVQFLDVVGKYPTLAQAMNLEQGVEMLNGVARKLGIGITLRVPEGVDPSMPLAGNPQDQFKQFAAGVQDAFKMISQELANQKKGQEALAQSVSDLASVVQTQATREGTVAPGIPRGAPPLPSVPAQPATVV